MSFIFRHVSFRFASSNLTTDWAKAAEDDTLGLSKGKKASRKRGDDSSDDEQEDEEYLGDMLLRDSSALKGGTGGVLEPGYLNIVR